LPPRRANSPRKAFGGARIDAIAARADINKRMLYHYYGGKDALYIAVSKRPMSASVRPRRNCTSPTATPAEAMRQLTMFTWHYFLDHPEFLSLLNTENLLRAKHLRKSKRIVALHSPLVSLLATTLDRGAKAGEFREGVDPVELYIDIAALGFFYTLQPLHAVDYLPPRPCRAGCAYPPREHIVEVIAAYLRRRNSACAYSARPASTLAFERRATSV